MLRYCPDLHSPAYGSHDRAVVGANGVRAAETKFEMLRLIENVQVINAAPSKYGSPNPYRTDARWTADSDRSSEDKRDSWSYRNDAGTSLWHREIEPFAVHDLEISGNSMAERIASLISSKRISLPR